MKQLVQKTLESFDQVNEWADFITFQAKLLKVSALDSSSSGSASTDTSRSQCLQAYPQFPVIPHKLIVAKRLSQCLNPALPTGVHQRALDVYTHILTTIGVSSFCMSAGYHSQLTRICRPTTCAEICLLGRQACFLSSNTRRRQSRYLLNSYFLRRIVRLSVGTAAYRA